jgi:outer membrane immunogenic protein
MKAFLIAAASLTASVATLAVAAPASAQSTSLSNVSWYGTLGYTDFNPNNANVSAVTGRLGARFGQYFGVEGELSGGIGNSHFDGASLHLQNQEAIYGVGFLPVAPNADLFARIGYGGADYKISDNGGSFHGNVQSWNFGAGGQYFFDHANGIRIDYTREDATDHGPDANVWGVAYVRKF